MYAAPAAPLAWPGRHRMLEQAAMLLSPMSAFAHLADSTRTSRHVRKVPEGNIRAGNYSISSSASVSKFGGTVIPSCVAVLRLTTSQNLLACSIGRSPGFTPRTILAA